MSYLGTNKIGKMYLGSTAIGKAYLGNNLVFQQGGVQPVMIPYIRGGADGSYIDTGITTDNTTKVIVWARNVNPAAGWFFGGRIASQNSQIGLFLPTTKPGAIRCLYYNNAVYDADDQFTNLSGYHKYELYQGVLKVDDVVQASGSTGSFSCPHNLYLFGMNTAGTLASPTRPIDICACQIYKNGTLVRDYTAVNTPSVGLYDAVSETLFTNAGSGSFTYGTFDTNAYTPLEYIECDGHQYFDSGIFGTYSIGIVTKFMPTNTTPQWRGVLGIWGNNNSCAISLGTASASEDNMRCYWRFGPNDTSGQAFSGSFTNKLTGKAVVAIKSNATLTLYYNNTQIGQNSKTGVSSSFVTNETLRVGMNNPVDPKFVGRLYYAGFGAERSLVSGKKGSQVGMYDTYNDVFYSSETDTPFIAGPTI